VSRGVLVAAMLVVLSAVPCVAEDSTPQASKQAAAHQGSARGAAATKGCPSAPACRPGLSKESPKAATAAPSQRPVVSVPPAAKRPPARDTFAYSRFSNRDSGVRREPIGRGGFGGSLSRSRSEPFAFQREHFKTAAAQPKQDSHFQFTNELSGTTSEVQPFSINGGKRCARIREGAFIHTRCF